MLGFKLNHVSKRGPKAYRGATISTSATQVFRVMNCRPMGDQSSVAAHSSGAYVTNTKRLLT